MKVIYLAAILLVIIIAAYFLGPRIDVPTYAETLPAVPRDLSALQRYVEDKEAKHPTRPGNRARIVWYGNTPTVTDYAFVYLHGFAGSYRDGYPVNVNVPEVFGSNVYLSRWAGHGLQAAAALQDFSPEAAWDDAREALAIGKRIGRRVVILSTSTGGTLAFKLAADFPDDVHALINMGPNVEDDQPGASLLMSPWGHELAMLASFGSNKTIKHEEPTAARYFDTIYPSRALVDLEILVQTTMADATFRKVQCPVLTLFYYRDAFDQDEHVEIDRYPEIHRLLATPQDQVRLDSLPTPGTHFVGSDIKSKDWMAAQRSIIAFCTEVLGMVPLLPVDHLTDATGL
ncbi:alpha/beta hydrolase [Neolewinella sp.]|uniref:alpha/beta hydrolase n=1 Tax=Neolewinella sp. TaxID=2993543 RepID=UPI003B51859A